MFDPDKSIYAYLTGDHSTWETRELIQWMNESPENKFKFMAIQEYWENTKETIALDQGALNDAYLKLSDTIFESSESPTKPYGKVVEMVVKPKSHKSVWLSVAASVALVLAVFISNLSGVVSANNEIDIISVISKENPAGRKSQIFLPDGSKVWLNAESRLVYNEDFGKKHRNIDLEGEAYFDIEKNKLLPFKVYTPKVCVTALGTEFNVRSYKNEHSIEVLLTEGKVEISDREHKISNEFLTEGESLSYSKTNDTYQKNVSDFDHLLAWKKGILSFHESSENEVFKILERWYGVNLNVAKGQSTHVWKYTSRFENESLENVLLSMGHVQNFDFRINGENVSLNYKN